MAPNAFPVFVSVESGRWSKNADSVEILGASTMKALTFVFVYTLSGPLGEEVPIPTYPAFVTMNFVAVDDPITNDGALPSVARGLIERRAHGVVLPIPTNPALVNVVVPVPPNDAVFARKLVAKRFEVVALPVVMRSVGNV